jgi:hypothetical protein
MGRLTGGNVMSLFLVAHIKCFALDNFMVCNDHNMVAPQTFHAQPPGLDTIARVKLAMVKKLARPDTVECEPMVIPAPEMIRPHEDKCVESQPEIHPFHRQRAMPVKA